MAPPPFTPAEDTELLEARRLGFQWAEIAALLGRGSPQGCRARWEKLSLRQRERIEAARRNV